jgi:hypothetical protein
MPDHDDVLSMVLDAADASEGYELRYFAVFRDNLPLLVTILDAGPAAGSQRYMVEVRPEPDRRPDLEAPYSLSNPEPNIPYALQGVHWDEFDAI